MMNKISLHIGKNISRIRKERDLSLDKVAELTGVSKAMLGQIERGESNPTVTTLWKIANGLRVSFSSLMKEEAVNVTVVSTENVQPVIDPEGRYLVYSLFPFTPQKQFEIFFVVLEPEHTQESEPHHPGVEEYIMVSEGTLEVMIDGDVYKIEKGHAIHFQADTPHAYRNSFTHPVTYFVMILYHI